MNNAIRMVFSPPSPLPPIYLLYRRPQICKTLAVPVPAMQVQHGITLEDVHLFTVPGLRS
jgi:hypothetical protein